ncbi:MAG: VCBS repeat-containing protein [Pseudomonadota bacterium]
MIACLAGASVAGAFEATYDLADLLEENGGDGSEGTVFSGEAVADSAGSYVRGLGDINGDDLDDFAIVASSADLDNRPNAGRVYLVYGTPSGFPAELTLASLHADAGGDGSAGVVLNGLGENVGVGDVVKRIGDVNADGFVDLIVTSRAAQPFGARQAGEAYVVFGPAQNLGVEFELRDLLPALGGDGSRGFVLSSYEDFTDVGVDATGGGDFNGDGIDDVAVSAVGATVDIRFGVGRIFVFFGRDDGAFSPRLDLNTLLVAEGGDGSVGVVLNGNSVNGGGAGRGLEQTDWNGDGLMDLLIGSPNTDVDDAEGAGQSYLLFGSSDPLPPELALTDLDPANGGDGSRGIVFNGSVAGASSGQSVGFADFDGDGVTDVLIGEDEAGAGGQLIVAYGASLAGVARKELADIVSGDGADGVALVGLPGERVGFPPASVDINGDGHQDVVIGTAEGLNTEGEQTGLAYVVYGGRPLGRPTLALGALRPAFGGDGSLGLVVDGIDAGDFAARRIAAAGDANGDGVGDLLIGASGAQRDGDRDVGEAYLLYGQPSLSAGTSVSGIDLRLAVCLNLTAPGEPIRVLFPGSDFESEVDCLRSGLLASSDDQVLLVLLGQAGDTGIAGGLTQGYAGANVDCRNRSTGARISAPLGPTGAWDCIDAGLPVAPGDELLIQLRGPLE